MISPDSTENKIIDHLFRHQHGKMVSILTRIFGLNQLDLIENAVQDTFISAMVKWRTQIPKNPEAWLTLAAKNRAIDLIRKIKADDTRIAKLQIDSDSFDIDTLFLDDQIEDSQLRMIFTACHPALNPKDQIAFALKTIAGFSQSEIASALLLKNETVKKRLVRARKTIRKNNITFELPNKTELLERLDRVHEVLYLIFNEGWHSNNKRMLIRKDLCGEAIRLTKLILKKEMFRNGAGYALFALMCFHTSRLSSRINNDFETIDLKSQDRSKWYQPLIQLGYSAMCKASDYNDYSSYHIEASIAIEHIKAKKFAETNWENILELYQDLNDIQEDNLIQLNIAMVYILLNQLDQAQNILKKLNPKTLEQRAYLYFGVQAEIHKKRGKHNAAIKSLDTALTMVNNEFERKYLMKKKMRIIEKL